MSYELSFSNEFFYEHSDYPELTNEPCSVYEALVNMFMKDSKRFNLMVKEVFGKDLINVCYYSENIYDDLIEKIKEYNECKNLNTPVEVCINENYSILVY